MARRRRSWDADSVRRLRSHLELTQREFAEELGVRQQTVSEWETGVYRPRGASERLLSIIADRAGYAYAAGEGAAAPDAAGEDDGARGRG